MIRPVIWAAGGAALALALALAGWHWLGARPLPTGVVPAASAPGSGPADLSPIERSLSLAAAAASASQQQPSSPEAASGASGSAAGIGSEGFGPHVQRALDSGDPRQALDAARWINSCRPDMDVESMINGSHPKYRLVLPADQQASVITKERQNQRRCQTLTPDLMAQQSMLALRALDAKVPGAGLVYYNGLNPEARSPAELERALEGLRVDAAHGEEMAVPLLAIGKLGQSRVEQLAYTRLMNLLILKDVLPPTVGLEMPKPPEPPYSPKEEADAAALVKRLWPRLKPAG
ncbi:hypothetical protein [Ideonella margarita]|uniref:Uncharacterized protein n=1 Tax=Ideonella margarita TaxID=2984191 RepID=A0ABU9C3A7_9BURK